MLFSRTLVVLGMAGMMSIVAGVWAVVTAAVPGQIIRVGATGQRESKPEPTTPRTSGSSLEAPYCAARQLRVSTRWGGAGMGQDYTIYVLTNTSTTTCSLSGAPHLTETTVSGTFSPILKEGNIRATDSHVALLPGHQASFYADFGSGCYDAALTNQARAPHKLLISFPAPVGIALAVRLSGVSPCAKQYVAVSPVTAGIISSPFLMPAVPRRAGPKPIRRSPSAIQSGMSPRASFK